MPRQRRRQKRRQRRAMNRGEARILYIIRLLAVRWAGSYNDNVLSALPWVRRHRPWWNKLLGIRDPSSGRHGREVLLAAHFVSVLCVVLRDFRKIWIHIISIHMFIWIHMQNKNSLPLTDHVNCASWRFFGFYFFSERGTKTFFLLSHGKIVWRQMVRSMYARGS